MNRLYGLVKKHPDGPIHLVSGRRLEAVCGARAEGNGWVWTARGVVTADRVPMMSGICHNCVKEVST